MKLLEPGFIGKLNLKNRVVMAAMGAHGLHEGEGLWGKRYRAYYGARAAGGVGLITTEATFVTQALEPFSRGLFNLASDKHLDSMRLKSLIASYFHVHVSEVHTRIIGEHGESMVPLWSATTIGGIKISNLPEFAHLPVQDIITSVKCSGQSIIQNKGSTVYGPGEAIASLVRTVLSDENRILTVSAYIKTEVHGFKTEVGVFAPFNTRYFHQIKKILFEKGNFIWHIAPRYVY